MERLREILPQILPVAEIVLMAGFVIMAIHCFYLATQGDIRFPLLNIFLGLVSLCFAIFLFFCIQGMEIPIFAVGIAIGLSAYWLFYVLFHKLIFPSLLGIIMVAYLICRFFV